MLNLGGVNIGYQSHETVELIGIPISWAGLRIWTFKLVDQIAP